MPPVEVKVRPVLQATVKLSVRRRMGKNWLRSVMTISGERVLHKMFRSRERVEAAVSVFNLTVLTSDSLDQLESRSCCNR